MCFFEEVIFSQRLESNRGADYLEEEHSRQKDPSAKVQRWPVSCRQVEVCITVAALHLPECDRKQLSILN